MKEKRKASSMYVLKRLLAYMVKNYKFSFLVVVVCIVIGAFATMQGDAVRTVAGGRLHCAAAEFGKS